jgi:hypothetical protein
MKAVTFVVCFFAACVVLAASEEKPASSQANTNQVPVGATTTNIVGVVYGDETNVVLRLSPVGGGTTSTIMRAYPKDIRFDEIIIVPTRPPLGDFWLRGEFERLLEEKL